MLQQFTHELKGMMDEKINGMHTAMPGAIVAFDASRCEATVQPIGMYYKPDGTTLNLPPISGVPVMVMQSAGQVASIVSPIKQGDGCLLIFAEQSLDTWKGDAESDLNIRFDLQNCIAIIGLVTKPNPLISEACERNAILISNGNTKISVMPDNTVEIEGNVSIKGNLTISGNTSISGNVTASEVTANVSLNTHTHVAPYEGGTTSTPN